MSSFYSASGLHYLCKKKRTMTLDTQTGLVLEGGGMRGVFTCGVLDYLMDRDIRFPYTIGVSAGACNGLSYMSRQRGRAKYSNIDLLEKYHTLVCAIYSRNEILWILIFCLLSFPSISCPMIMMLTFLLPNVL